MSERYIIYSPETMAYTLSNGTDRITLPNWARRVIGDEFEREVRPLSKKIEILSDALALARVENAKLQEELESVGTAAYLYGRSDLKAENAKLRELAEKAWKAAEMLCQAWSGPCHADDVSIKPPCPLGERDELCVYGLIQRDLRELGVEVDG